LSRVGARASAPTRFYLISGMLDDILGRVFASQWPVFFVIVTLLLSLAEAGYRLGSAARRRNPEAAAGHSGSVQGAVLGLLGLLLGFTFAMSVGRNDTRRSLMVEEANSIGTTWLRACFLPEPRDTEVRDLLRRYAVIRMSTHQVTANEEAFQKLVAESTAIQNTLWELAKRLAAEKPDPITASFITTLNETIDLQSSRLAARSNHVPGAVWLLLLIVAACSAWASGYGSGTVGHRSAFSQIVFPVLIGVVITLIADIDRPNKGLIGVSQQPMKDLIESMN
jgi:hypothetical protein